jgi:gamma-glutamylcyclotransferase (GGCT)/AIG2-like uncharacterized protein YtfP
LAPTENNIVHGEVFRIIDPKVIYELDRWEEYDPISKERSKYIRRYIRLLEPSVDAWVYISNQSQDDPVIKDGDWINFAEGEGIRYTLNGPVSQTREMK